MAGFVDVTGIYLLIFTVQNQILSIIIRIDSVLWDNRQL